MRPHQSFLRLSSVGIFAIPLVAVPLPGFIARSASTFSVAQSNTPILRGDSVSAPISLEVDATDTRHEIIAARETIPVSSTVDFTLLYPEWETASHAPTVPLASLTGLVMDADGQRIEWHRDPLDVHAFHVVLPAGTRHLTLRLQYLADRGMMQTDMLFVPWQRLLLYPAGRSVASIRVAASLHVPAGLTVVTSLDRQAVDGDILHYATVPLDHLVDAPAYAARLVRQVDLAPRAAQPVRLDLLAHDTADLAITEDELAKTRVMIAQTGRVFGPPPFRHYDAIVTLDDMLGPGGIEHLEEGENNLPAAYFVDPASQLNNLDLIAHEFVHAWNGRFRQPADLWTPTYNQPAGGSLLWVYEGQTEFWGRVLAARAGLRSRQDTLDKLALDAASVDNRPGRAWKSLADSTNDAVYMAGHHVAWRDWQRREDYYSEGVLLWLDVDARLRELSGGKRGLDDFAARFFHADKPDAPASTYTFEDVCAALDAVAPDDWRSFLQRHLDTHDTAEALAGLSRAGWQLVYTGVPTQAFRETEAESGGLDLTYSIGLVIEDDGRIDSVAWDSPAFRAGLAVGMRIRLVSGQPYSRDAMQTAVGATPSARLTVDAGTATKPKVLSFDYHEGLRYPRLVEIPGKADRITPLLMAR